jgi:DNA-binding response OmpR family regulator
MSSERATLLVVDDDAEIRELIQAYLDGQGYHVICAEDAPAMDEVLAESSVDLILLDLMLPGEDGLSIAKRLKASSNTPIIMVSAQGEAVDRIVGLEIGADDYIGKPFDLEELLARIRMVTRRVYAGQPGPRPNAMAVAPPPNPD